MSFNSLLNSTATIKRQSVSGTDGNGNDVFSWANLATDVPCRVSDAARREGREIRVGEEVTVYNQTIYCKSGVDVTEADRVVIGSRTYNVMLVVQNDGMKAAHHKQLYVQEVRE